MRILICNDDGVHAPGIRALALELKKLGSVTVVAPLEEKSTTGHSLTLHKPLRVLEIEESFFGVSGSPADCVYLAVRKLLKHKPDLVVSGINRGANLGQDVYYSGTVSAAREARIIGLPALAVSLVVDFEKFRSESVLNYQSAAKLTAQVIAEYPPQLLPKHCFYNFNVPDRPLSKIGGIQLASQGFRFYNGTVLTRKDHRGRPYYWVGGKYRGYHAAPGTDCQVCDSGNASLTPIQLDSTDHALLSELQEVHARKPPFRKKGGRG